MAPVPRKRFAVEDDLQLLREVLRLNPFTDTHQWTSVAHAVNVARDKEFTSRGCRERTELLIGLLRKKEWVNLRKFGTEEIYKEKEALLQRVSDLEAEFVPASKSRTVTAVRRGRTATAKEVATAVVEPVTFVADTTKEGSSSSTLCHLYEQGGTSSSQPSIVYESQDDDNIITGDEDVVFPTEGVITRWPSKKDNGKRRNDTFETASQSFAQEQAIREKELDLEERKLKLEEERLSLERAKFEADREFEMRRLQMEEDDRRSRRESEKLQADLMKTMFEVFVKRMQ